MSISLSTANVIYAWAYPVIAIGILLTSAGTIAVFYAGGALNRHAAVEARAAANDGKPVLDRPVMLDVARAAVDAAPPTPPASMSATAAPPQTPPGEPSTTALRPSLAFPSQGETSATPAGSTQTAAAPAEDRTGWRGLSLRQQAGMRAILSGAPGEVWFMTEEDPEAQHYADALAQVFRKSGWTERRSLIPSKGSLRGLAFVRDASTPDWAIKRAFDIAGLPLGARGRDGDEPAPAIYVGARAPKS